MLADTAFASSDYSPPPKSVIIEGTPLDRAIKDVEHRFGDLKRPAPVCRASVHSATVFQQPPGRMMCAIGTDNGVYISEYNDPRGWVRVCIYLTPLHRSVYTADGDMTNILLGNPNSPGDPDRRF